MGELFIFWLSFLAYSTAMDVLDDLTVVMALLYYKWVIKALLYCFLSEVGCLVVLK